MSRRPQLLRVANACHPAMDDHQRHRILAAVADDLRDDAWSNRLRRAPDGTASVAMAMRLLRELEEPWGDHHGPPTMEAEGWRTTTTPRRPLVAIVSWVVALLLLLWILCAHLCTH
jgi:hypothetical protein